MNIGWTLILMLVCLLLEGFFSGSEIAIISADRMKLRHAAAKGSPGAQLALKLLKTPDWLLAVTLLGNNIAVVANTTLATALAITLFGEQYGWVAIFTLTPFIWIFGEVVPKSVFQHYADSITPKTVFFLQAASFIFWPILALFSRLTRMAGRAFGGSDQNPFTLREEIIAMLHMPVKGGDIQHEEKDMIRRVFNFSETTADTVMVPLIDVVAIDQKATCGEALRMAADSAHVRLPVFEERVDRVIGVLNTLELLGADPAQPITTYIRPVRYVPGSRGIHELFLDLRQDGNTPAIVVDEYGGAEGLVTIEDIMEEVVADMEDEYDVNESSQQWIRKISERDYVVSARIEIDNLVEKLGIEIPEGDYVTLAGFLLEKAREVPAAGSVIKGDGITYIVLKSTPQTILEVRVRW